jgi:hypothetical protein
MAAVLSNKSAGCSQAAARCSKPFTRRAPLVVRAQKANGAEDMVRGTEASNMIEGAVPLALRVLQYNSTHMHQSH